MNPLQRLRTIQDAYHRNCPKKSLRQEWHDFLHDRNGRLDMKALTVAAALGVYAAGSAAALIWSARLIDLMKDNKVMTLILLPAVIAYGACTARSAKKRQEFAQEFRRNASKAGGVGSAFLFARLGGHGFPFAYALGELTHHFTTHTRPAAAVAAGTACALTTALSAGLLRETWKIEKLPTLYSAGIGLCHGTLLILGSSYLVNHFDAAQKDNAVGLPAGDPPALVFPATERLMPLSAP